jgi:uncharacterized protein
MQTLAVLGVVGFAAQLVNSSLGMGYGVSATSVLLMLGTSPAMAAATVNVSQVGSQLAAGIAHWRLGNVDWAVVRRIAVPGAVGAFIGATFLSWLASDLAAPLMAGVLLVLGLYVMARFARRDRPRGRAAGPLRRRFLGPLGLVGGFLNSTGGGGWGPVGTSALLASGRLAPRKVIGSICAAEFAVVLAGSAGFAVGLGLAGIRLQWAAAMLAGGLLSAPIAAWLAAHIPPGLLGSLVGGLIVVTNLRTLLHGGWLTVPPPLPAVGLAAGLLLWAAALAWSVRTHLAARSAIRQPVGP